MGSLKNIHTNIKYSLHKKTLNFPICRALFSLECNNFKDVISQQISPKHKTILHLGLLIFFPVVW